MGVVGKVAGRIGDTSDGSQSIGARYRRVVYEVAVAQLPAKLDRLHADTVRQEHLLSALVTGQQDMVGLLRELLAAQRGQSER
jgi:hypothetical protein